MIDEAMGGVVLRGGQNPPSQTGDRWSRSPPCGSSCQAGCWYPCP